MADYYQTNNKQFSGNQTIAIVKTKEEYDSVRVSLQNVINDVNRMSDGGSMMLGGTKITLEFFLGGDYSTAQNQANIERAFITRRVKRAHAFCCVRLRLNFAL